MYIKLHLEIPEAINSRKVGIKVTFPVELCQLKVKRGLFTNEHHVYSWQSIWFNKRKSISIPINWGLPVNWIFCSPRGKHAKQVPLLCYQCVCVCKVTFSSAIKSEILRKLSRISQFCRLIATPPQNHAINNSQCYVQVNPQKTNQTKFPDRWWFCVDRHFVRIFITTMRQPYWDGDRCGSLHCMFRGNFNGWLPMYHWLMLPIRKDYLNWKTCAVSRYTIAGINSEWRSTSLESTKVNDRKRVQDLVFTSSLKGF